MSLSKKEGIQRACSGGLVSCIYKQAAMHPRTHTRPLIFITIFLPQVKLVKFDAKPGVGARLLPPTVVTHVHLGSRCSGFQKLRTAGRRRECDPGYEG